MVGSLDLQRVLRDGEHAFSPGLLARAHGGVLYVDEVNLLHDHLVDVLLDAAAMGRVHIERDGVSHSHEARFVLIGTMNPEEGELRPQLLDRFGLTVDVHASRDVDVRVPRSSGSGWRSRPTRPAFAALYAESRRRTGRPHRRGARLRRRCGAAGQRVTAHRGAVRGVRRRRDACRSGGGADGGRARRVARSRHGRRGGHPGRGRTRAAAPAPARPVRRSRLDPSSSTTRWQQTRDQADDPEPDPEPPDGGGTSADRSDHPAPQGNSARRNPTQCAAVGGLPDPGTGGSRRGGGRAGAEVAARNRTGTSVSSTIGSPTRVTGCMSSDAAGCGRRQQRPGRPRPRADDVRHASGKAAKAIW